MHRFDTEQVARDVSSGVDATEDGMDGLPDDAGTPERSLMLAALKDGILKLRKGFRKPNSIRPVEWHELQAWFASDSTEHPFSFLTICDTLAIDAPGIRRRLADYKHEIESARDNVAREIQAAATFERMVEFEASREQHA